MRKKRAKRKSPARKKARTRTIRPVIIESDGQYFRPKYKKGRKKGKVSSKTFSKATRINPKRRKRRYRRNPGLPKLRTTFSVKNLTYMASIGGGVALGFLGIPLIDRYMPQVVKDQRKWAYGVMYILAGSMMAGAFRNKNLKALSLTLAGMGAYDLIQQNLLPDLPMISTSNPLVTNLLPAAAAEPASANYEQIAANYQGIPGGYDMAPVAAMSADYTPLEGESPYEGIF